MDRSKIKVVLICGGTSPEREVSKSSGFSITKSLKNLGYNYKIIDPAYGHNQPENEEEYFKEKDAAELSNRNYLDVINSELFDGIDVAFITLHGQWGEDGTIQSVLELRGIKYTGCGVLASSLAMDKDFSKVMFRHSGVQTADWIIGNSEKDYDRIMDFINKEIGYPAIIKPNNGGSTIGLSVCKKQEDVLQAVKTALKFSEKFLVERFIEGRELAVGILNEIALPPVEIKPVHEIYDYECKYSDGMCSYDVPAILPENIKIQLQDQAIKAYKSLGCRGYSRVDFRLTTNSESYCLEINTLPGMTSHSLLPKSAQAAGISYDELVDRIIQSAMI
ncbi:MAG: D-alanine--D-alanine ligase [Ignavibacteria bacterium]|nr:D-alanine--D-alanine ligase [Ignavibacteria bacterium]